KFQLDYPENIERWGASFNTNMFGLALGGEFSYRRNAPLQMTEPLFLAGPAAGPFMAYIGPYLAGGGSLGDVVKGYERIERYQTQLTVQKNWGVLHALKADGASTIGEIAWGWIGGLPSLTPVGGPLGTQPNPLGGTNTLYNVFESQVSEDFGKLVIRHSMTYQAALFNLIALEPNFAFAWDFHGYSNELGGAKLMVEGRKALSVGLGFDYGSGRWKGGISYTTFWGDDDEVNGAGSRLNGSTDRDFLSFNASYSF
ncbi:MAG TPA: peptide ABC transporter substrate-binding protein, partial [Gammaproteobacteria bacterium]|nr:peptide ABC transporter substrate-binding protein [Gammaproteobacteria bacterium]